MEALRTIGAHQPVLDNSFPAGRADFISNTGKRLGGRPMAGSEEGALSARTIKRATLARVLREEAARRGVRVEHGKRLLAAQTGPDGRVVASFADGGRAQGTCSSAPTESTPSSAGPSKPRRPGHASPASTRCAATLATPRRPGPRQLRHDLRQARVLRLHHGPDGEVWWFANTPGAELSKDELAAITPEQWREQLAGLFADDNTPAAEIIRASGESIVATNAYDIASTPTWSDEAMVLVGDAVHACAPNAAQGASLAIEDGVVLAKCLRDLRTPRSAFAAYERLRRERVERVVATSAGLVRRTVPGPVGRALRDAILPRKLERADADGGADWLTGYRIDWDERVTGEVARARR
ncbi:FAD-dependent monooxygenase [Streptomyces sp. FXJ1.4098]|nr:FAD-dependent monooxygenase [Streptomyces sp. FXJ1.4098]